MYYITTVVHYFESKRETPTFRPSIITSCNLNVLKFRDLFRQIWMRPRGWRVSFPSALIALIILSSMKFCLSLSEVYSPPSVMVLHCPSILENYQLCPQFLYSIIRLLQSFTCFEQRCTHHQEVKCINTASGIVTL